VVPVQVQLELRRPGRGGPRPGAGRKRKPGAIRHDRRPEVSRHTPVHVSARVIGDVGRLRRRDACRAIRGAVATYIGRRDFRIVHVSIQSNHVHLIVEADHKRALANGMRAFLISSTRRLNALRGRTGVAFARYHAVPITGPRQARSALSYVLNNWRRHREDRAGAEARRATLDPYSTAVLFDGWATPSGRYEIPSWYEPMLVHAPRSWLLNEGWRKYPPLDPRERPGPLRSG